MTALSSPLARTRATRLLVVVLGLLLAAAALISPGASAQGSPALAPTASIVVNDAGDTTGACATTGTGACTLRDAITYANSNAGADTITFNIPFLGGCTGVNQCTITLGSALPDITDDVTIDGAPNSARITINGNSNRILQVNNNGSTTFGALTVNALTLENGSYFLGGGAIGNRGGTVNVTNSTFFNNSVIANSAGGAIYNSIGTVNVTNSTFTDNSATGSGNGGAIWNQATLNVTSSTFSGNSAGGSGGGIYTFAPGTTTLRNTIIANSTSGGDCHNAGGTINAEYSLIEDGLTCVNGTNSNNLTGDPNLGPLADNGGPTQTHALLTGSPAIDAGDTALATDQRGEPRPIGSADDIGAYERQFCEQDAWLVSDETELNEAIACYNAKPVAGTYPITATQNISLTASTTQINNATAGVSLVIEGGGFAVDGQGTAGVRPFDIAANTTVTMNDLTITGGRASSRGGGILNVGTLRVNYSLITGNESTAGGGGIANGINNSSGSTLVVNNSTISNNTAREDGGGVSNWPGSGTTIRNSTISGNTANIGGGIENFSFNSPASVWVSNSTISGNTASNRGGGIHGSYNFGGGHIEIDSSTITNNRANNGGSGLYSFQNATITVKNSIIALQQAGGADCEVQTGTPITSNGHNISSDATCGFTSTGDQQNVSAAALNLGPLADNGGPTQTHALQVCSVAIDAGDTTLTTDQRGQSRPFGTDDIGAFELQSLAVSGWTVSNEDELNAAITCYNSQTTADTYTITLAGDIALTASTTPIQNPVNTGVSLVIEGAGHTVNGQNTPGVRPFALHPSNLTPVTINQITITGGNVAGDSGGGIQVVNGHLTVTNSTISGNRASAGGGISVGSLIFSRLTLQNSTISGNRADSGFGGGILVSGPATIDSSTIVDNQAVSGGGGALGATGSNANVTVTNSILANSTAPGGGSGVADCAVSAGAGTVTDGGYNLVETPGNCSFAATGSITGSDPVLGPLANNGGPTWTHALLAGSPAIDAGSTTQTSDQRGVARPQGAADDIGAFELGCPAFPLNAANEGELNFAIGCYNQQTAPGTYTINITRDIDLTARTIAINNATSLVELMIEGGGHTIDGQGISGVRAFQIDNNTKVTIQNITVIRCLVSGAGDESGGAISVVGGTLTVIGSTLSGNQSGFGAAISNAQGTLTVINSTLSGNNAVGTFLSAGAAIYAVGSPFQSTTTTVINSTLSGNRSNGRGGGIYNGPDSVVTVINSTISDNQAPDGGGGVVNSVDSTLTLHNSIVANSTGGDCLLAGGTINAEYSLIEDGLACVNGTNSNNLTGDPSLGPLANNGGPTQTHALLAGSVAINVGNNALAVDQNSNPLQTDQRGAGYPRIQAGTVDMGAFEAEPGTITIVKVTQPANNTSFDFADNIVAPNAFTLSDGQQKDFLIVPTGVYTVTEASNTGSFQLRNLVCVDGDPNGQPSTGDVGTRTATINLDSGETVTCTFTNSNRPLAVTLASFEAVAQTDHVLVTWETVSELENAGFNLYRTATADPPSAADLQAYVPSQGPGSVLGYLYSHQDYDVTAGQTIWYWLEDVDLNGITTMHGPVSVVFVGPTAVTLSGLAASAGDPAPLAWPWFVAALAALLAMAVARRRSMNS